MLRAQLARCMVSMATRACVSRDSTGSAAGGPVEAAIRAKLEQALSPEVLELRNESGGHAVPAGSETHFRVAVVSSRFEGLSPLQRHRLVHAALSEELAGPVHALAIQAKTPAQWRENPQLDTSPLPRWKQENSRDLLIPDWENNHPNGPNENKPLNHYYLIP